MSLALGALASNIFTTKNLMFGVAATTLALGGAAAASGAFDGDSVFSSLTTGEQGTVVKGVTLEQQQELAQRLREAFDLRTHPSLKIFDVNHNGTLEDSEIARAFITNILKERGLKNIPEWLQAMAQDQTGKWSLEELFKHDGITAVSDPDGKTMRFGFGYDWEQVQMGRQRKEAIDAFLTGNSKLFLKELIDLFNFHRQGVIAIPPGKIDPDQFMKVYANALSMTRPDVDPRQLATAFKDLGLRDIALQIRDIALQSKNDRGSADMLLASTTKEILSYIKDANRLNVVENGSNTYLAAIHNAGVQIMTTKAAVKEYLPGVDILPPSVEQYGVSTNLPKASVPTRDLQ